MAIIKRIDVDGVYWRVTRVGMDWDSLSAGVVLAVYVDSESRRRGEGPIATRSYEIDLASVLSAPITISSLMDVASVVYGVIKLHPDFYGAVDALEADQSAIEVGEFPDLPVQNVPSPD